MQPLPTYNSLKVYGNWKDGENTFLFLWFKWTRCSKSKPFFVRRLCQQMQRFKLNRQWYWTTSWLIWNDSFERDCPQCKIWCHFGSTKFNGTSFCFLWSLRVHLHCNNILKEFFFKQYRYRFFGHQTGNKMTCIIYFVHYT